MGSKTEFMSALRWLADDLVGLTMQAENTETRRRLLSGKLDELCVFILSMENERLWQCWGGDSDVVSCSGKLRDAAARALGELEKIQAIHTYALRKSGSLYAHMVSAAFRQELIDMRIERDSKVVLIGAGSFPFSAMTIAEQTGAEVLCADIDAEAVFLGQHVIEASGLQANIRYPGMPLMEQSFLREATHVILASLVPDKASVLADWMPRLNGSAAIITRYGDGLKSVFNYPLEPRIAEDWQLIPLPVRQRSRLYDTLILEPKASFAAR